MNEWKYNNYDFNNPKYRYREYAGVKTDRKRVREYYNPFDTTWSTRKPTKGKKYQKWKSESFKIKNLFTPKALDPTRIDRTRKIDNLYLIEENYANTSSIQYIFHSLFYRSHFASEDGLVNLSSQYLAEVLGANYKPSLDYMIKKEWLKCDDDYHFDTERPENSYSRRYAINTKYLTQTFNFSNHPAYTYKLNNRLIEREKEYNKLLHIKETYKNIIEMAGEARYDLDAFLSEVDQEEVGKKKGYEISVRLMESLNNGELSFSNKIAKNERSYTTHSRVIREARKYIYFNDLSNRLVEFDISSCQYWLLGQLSNNKFFDQIILNQERNGTKKARYKELKRQISKIKNEPSFKQFISDTCNGSFYENIVDDFNSKCQLTGEIIVRQQAKDIAMEAIFSNKYSNKEQKSVIRSVYPSVMKLVDKISFGDNSKVLVNACQVAEARFMLDHYCQSLYHTGNNKFITVHDSVMVQQKDATYTKELFREECDRFGIDYPIFEEK